jgi:ATP-dependent Clp protease ATP-binding subunit ClpC
VAVVSASSSKTIKAESQYNRIRSLVNEELKQYFRPEFLNRLDEIIVFRQLTKDEVKEISDILLKEVFIRLTEKEHHPGCDRTLQRALGGRRVQPQLWGKAIASGDYATTGRYPGGRNSVWSLGEGDTATVDVDESGKVIIQAARRQELLSQVTE